MTEVAEKTHALLSPSGAARWSRCPGSVVLEAPFPNDTSKYARWGTAAHELASWCLEHSGKEPQVWNPANAKGYLGRIIHVEGHDIEVDMEMADCVNTYVAHVEEYWEPGDILLVEQSVPLEHITGEKGATGTSDVIIIKPKRREIVCIDLKGGAGVEVYADDNEQTTMYIGGALEEHDLFHGPFEWATSVIVQPRRDHISEERITVGELRERLEKLSNAARRAMSLVEAPGIFPPGRLNPGEKQCRFCRAKSVCPALNGFVTETLGATAGRDDFPDLSLPKQAAAAVVPEDGEALAAAMRAAPLIEIWMIGVRAEVDRRLAGGQPVPGFYLGQGKQSNRAWQSEHAAEEALKKLRLGVDAVYTKKVISPTKAEVLLKKEPKKWAKIAPLIAPRQPGKPTVCKDGDKTAPWVPPTAESQDFPDLDAAETVKTIFDGLQKVGFVLLNANGDVIERYEPEDDLFA